MNRSPVCPIGHRSHSGEAEAGGQLLATRQAPETRLAEWKSQFGPRSVLIQNSTAACCPRKRELGKIDPSRASVRIAGGRLAGGRDDLSIPPDFADGGGWLGGAAPTGLRLGTANCNIAGRDHKDDKSRKARSSGGTRAVEEHPGPSLPFPWRGGTGQQRRLMAG
jgi:hypothetical protein